MSGLWRVRAAVCGVSAVLLMTACGADPRVPPATGTSPATAAAGRRPVSRVAATIEIEKQGILVVDSAASMLYVVSEGSVLFIDTNTRQVAGKVDLGGRPGSAVLDPEAGVLYVAQDAGTVSAIDVATRKVRATIAVGESPGELVLDAAAHTLYVANYGVDQADGPSVSVIDTVRQQAVSTITIGVTRTADGGDFSNMGPMFLDPAGHALYVRGGILSVVDTRKRKVVSKHKIAENGGGTVLDPGAHALFLRGPRDGMAVFDTSARKIVASIKAPSMGQLILDPAGHVLYVGDRDGTVSVIDTMGQKVTGTFPAGPLVFWAGVVDPEVNALYLFQPGKISPGAGGRDTVTVIDTATRQVIGRIPVGAEGPLTMEFPLVFGVVDPATGVVYVECLLANTPAIQILQA